MSDISVQDLLADFEILNETVPLAPLRWSLAHYQPFISLGWAVSGLNLAGNPVLTMTGGRVVFDALR